MTNKVDGAGASTMNRCIGCRWHIPKKYGGQGIICLAKDGKCPDWAVQGAMDWIRKPKGSVGDDEILERMRL
uniref:Uncharacterized protein n=1 Tax=viral metagenome TaxID=1070528 RepID=A0A6M3JEI0_9ZZZZ